MLRVVRDEDKSPEGSITEALRWARSKEGDPRPRLELLEEYRHALECLIEGGQIRDLVIRGKQVIDQSVKPPKKMSFRQAMIMVLEMALGIK